MASVVAGMLIAFILLAFSPLRALAIQGTLRVTSMLPQTDTNGRINILVLGVGDREHQAADLTDAMIIASIDPATPDIVMLSIPRDLAIVDRDGTLRGRINSLYWIEKKYVERQDKTLSANDASLQALKVLAADIGELTGTPIQGVIKMDFTGFEQIVDGIGGIDIVVPKAITDYSYPLEEGIVGTWEVAAGPQHFDGETALRYARSRHSTSDFDRSARQQQIASAIVETVRQQGIIENLGLIRQLQLTLHDHVETTFAPRELLGIGGLLSSIRMENIIRMSLTYDTGSDVSDAVAGGFVRNAPTEIAGSGALLLPVSLTGEPSDWDQIRSFAHTLFSDRALYLAHAPIVIETAGVSALHSHRLWNELTRYGLTAQEEKDEAQTISSVTYSDHRMQGNAETLATLLGLTATQSEGVSFDGLRVELGKNYRFAPVQQQLSHMQEAD